MLKVVIGGGIGAVVLLLAWLFVSENARAKQVDDCVSHLETVLANPAAPQDSTKLQIGPSLFEDLKGSPNAEVAYARPKDSKWARVGLVVDSIPGQDTIAPKGKKSRALFGLLLNLDQLPNCRFVRDFEEGPFGSHGRDGQLSVQE